MYQKTKEISVYDRPVKVLDDLGNEGGYHGAFALDQGYKELNKE